MLAATLTGHTLPVPTSLAVLVALHPGEAGAGRLALSWRERDDGKGRKAFNWQWFVVMPHTHTTHTELMQTPTKLVKCLVDLADEDSCVSIVVELDGQGEANTIVEHDLALCGSSHCTEGKRRKVGGGGGGGEVCKGKWKDG